jgi:hypothetical protein
MVKAVVIFMPMSSKSISACFLRFASMRIVILAVAISKPSGTLIYTNVIILSAYAVNIKANDSKSTVTTPSPIISPN